MMGWVRTYLQPQCEILLYLNLEVSDVLTVVKWPARISNMVAIGLQSTYQVIFLVDEIKLTH